MHNFLALPLPPEWTVEQLIFRWALLGKMDQAKRITDPLCPSLIHLARSKLSVLPYLSCLSRPEK